MKELLTYLISITSFTLLPVCELNLNGYAEIYSSGKNKIYICENIERPRNEIILHEIGHIYRFRLMTEEKKARVKELYNKGIFVSEYSKVNEVEYFAEIFSYYIINKKSPN